MPSIGTATALIVARRINEAMETSFDEKTRKDAYKFLTLSSDGGDITYIIIIIALGTLLTIDVFFIARINGLVIAIVTGVISLTAFYWAIWRRRKARRDLDALVTSNPTYWLPITNKVGQIILDAGKFEDGLYPSQATRIVK